jgi:hypothetical protein
VSSNPRPRPIFVEEEYRREITVTIRELVPSNEMLPQCVAWKYDGYQCPNPGKYIQENEPVCGVHMGRPGLLFLPSSRRR